MLLKIRDFLKTIRPKKVGIVTHINADPDCVGSAYGIHALLTKYFRIENVNVIFPEGPSKLSKKLLKKYGTSTEYSEYSLNESAYIIVDTQSPETLGNEKKILEKKIFIIDHHQPNNQILERAFDYIVREETATCVLVYEILKETGISYKIDVLNLLAAGIIFDSRRFLQASSDTFKIFYELVKQGIDYKGILEALTEEMDFSERIARLKAAKRAIIFKANQWIIAFTNVGSFEASAARALVELGADLAFAANENKGYIRISARSTNKFYSETGINLALDIMKSLCTIMDGIGGGHKSAAGFNGEGTIEVAFNFIRRKLEDLMKTRLILIA